MYGKADKIPNKGPSTNDFTNGYKQKLDSLKNYDDTSIKKEISNIKTEQVTQNNNISNLQKENEELKEENKHLKEDLNGLPSGTFSGENIDITDSAEMRCELNIRGNSKQKTSTQGKNRLDLRDATYMVSDVNVIKNGSTLTLNGTMNTSGNLLNTVGDMYSFVYLGKFKIGTYRFSKFIISGKYSKNESIGVGSFACYIRKKDKELLGEILGSASNREGVTITLKEETDLYIQIFCNAGAIFDNYVIGFQLEEGSTTTDLEEFKPNMPSLDYPSEIACCGDNVNLLNISSSNETVIRILDDEATISYDNEIVKVTRKVINHSNAQTGIFYAFNTKEGKEYTVTPIFSSAGVVNVRVFKDNTNTTVLSGNITSGESYTFIAEQGQYWLRFWISNNFVGESILYAKVVEGREATPYSPYGQGCINEVICNKNISNIEKFDVSGGIGLTYPKIIQGLKENTEYTLSFYKSRIIGTTISNTSLHGCRQIHFYHNEKKLSEYTYNSPVSNFSSGNRKFEIKINTPSKCNKIICYFDNSNGDNNVNTMVYDIQLEEGTATDYKEHKSQTYTIPTQQPFRAIENTRDTFIKKNNKWYERHYSSRYVFTGNEEWRKHESIKNNAYYLNPLSNPIKDMMKKPTNNKEALPLYSNRFIYKSTEDIAFSNIEGISISVLGDIYIGTTLSGISSLDELKTYLQQNKTYFDFLLQTPTDIECTEEQNKILDKIENEAKTYKNITHVYSIDKVSSNAEITYKKDLETLFSNALTKEV